MVKDVPCVQRSEGPPARRWEGGAPVMPPATTLLLRYYLAFGRAWAGMPPRDDTELHAWCYRHLALLWNSPSMLGSTLGGFLTTSPEGKRGLARLSARVPPIISLVFFGWPLAALALSYQKSLATWHTNWKVALTRPDLFLAVGRGPYSAQDAERVLTCLLHIIIGIYQYNHEPSPGFTIDDKLAFYRWCAELGLPTVPVIDPADVDPSREYIAKPARSTQGRGIFKALGHEVATRVDFRTHFLQPLLKNSGLLAAVAGPEAGLCTLRVNTINTKGGPPRALGAFLRLARAGTVVDNFHAGGVACPVDLQTGVVQAGATEEGKWASWAEMRSVHAHPDTGVSFADVLVVPHFERAKALCEQAHGSIDPALLVCSWDVALTDDGPILVEASSCLGGTLEMLHWPDTQLYLDVLREKVCSML
jgi:Sugar-transfer associated ATP-grasp